MMVQSIARMIAVSETAVLVSNATAGSVLGLFASKRYLVDADLGDLTRSAQERAAGKKKQTSRLLVLHPFFGASSPLLS
jgi:hypothetical protein